MLRVTAFKPSARIQLGFARPALAAGVVAEVERLWQAEQARRDVPLLNGKILSALEIGPERILGRIAEYRHLVAQQARPELFAELNVRPVAVSGVFECAAGVLLGRRANSCTQDAGLWELCPSGGLDVSRTVPGADVDYRAQILTELAEEVGVTATAVRKTTPICLIEDPNSHVIDVGIELQSPLAAQEVVRLHRDSASKEYAELAIVAREDLGAFLAAKRGQMVGVSVALIDFAEMSKKT
jgi:hypothetical protein